MAKEIQEVAGKLKLLEERYNILRKKSQLDEQNLIELDRNQFKEIRLLQEKMLNIKRSIKEINEQVAILNQEFQEVVKQRDFVPLKKYVDLWQPMDFVTRKEVNAFLRKKFSK